MMISYFKLNNLKKLIITYNKLVKSQKPLFQELMLVVGTIEWKEANNIGYIALKQEETRINKKNLSNSW